MAIAEPTEVPRIAPSFDRGYPTTDGAAQLDDELLFHYAVLAYLWAMPTLNLYAMKEASEKAFGKGYNVLPIWKRRLDAKTLIATPNSDVLYALGYLNVKKDGPLVVEVPPGLQGVLDDGAQRPLRSDGAIDGTYWSGDVGLPGPDRGSGGKYLIVPPDFNGAIPPEHFVYRSRTYGVFLFWRAFFEKPSQLEAPVKLLERTRIYPLGQSSSAVAMRFPDASGVPVNMLVPRSHAAFDMLKRYLEDEYVDLRDFDMRGVFAALGIVKGLPFLVDAHAREILDRAARRGSELGRYVAYVVTERAPGGKYYADRRWVNSVTSDPGTPDFITSTYTDVRLRAGFFSIGYSASPSMAIKIPDVGAKYPTAFRDAEGEFLRGERSYRLRLPANIPAKIFWSITLYDAETTAGLDNGQPFPSISSMDQPAVNADGSVDFIFGPSSPGARANWIATVPERGFFVMLRLYGPTKPFFDQSWKPGDVERMN